MIRAIFRSSKNNHFRPRKDGIGALIARFVAQPGMRFGADLFKGNAAVTTDPAKAAP